jgi:hypothetical protein
VPLPSSSSDAVPVVDPLPALGSIESAPSAVAVAPPPSDEPHAIVKTSHPAP